MTTLKDNIRQDSLLLASSDEYMRMYQHPSMLLSISKELVPDSPERAWQEMLKLDSVKALGQGEYFGLYDKKRFIGTCGLHSFDSQANTIETSYEVHPEYWGQGIATLALSACIQLAFSKHAGITVLAYTLADNIISQRVAIKAGMQCVRFIHNDIYFNGSWRDRKVFSIQDYRA